MKPCASCGYPTHPDSLKNGYCGVCRAIGAPQINSNPQAFGDAKFFVPPLAWATNRLLDAIATRAEDPEFKLEPGKMYPAEAGRQVFLILSPTKDGPSEFVEWQDAAGNKIEPPSKPVQGTEFVSVGPFILK